MVLKIDKKQPNNEIISQAAACLKSGALLVYPTDTAYGLGANATNPSAVSKLYALKGRKVSKPTHVVVRDWETVTNLCEVSDSAYKLFHAFLPGPLTLVLRSKGKVDPILEAGTNTLGVRMPNCEFTLVLSHRVDFPYTAPSANLSGGLTPYSIEEIDLDLDKVGLVVDAGVLPKITPSTIVDLTGESLRIIREGPITESEIESVLSKY